MDEGFARVDERFEQMDKRLDRIEDRIEGTGKVLFSLQQTIVNVSLGMFASLIAGLIVVLVTSL